MNIAGYTLTAHAQRRMAERGIDAGTVRLCLSEPERVRPDRDGVCDNLERGGFYCVVDEAQRIVVTVGLRRPPAIARIDSGEIVTMRVAKRRWGGGRARKGMR